MFPQGVREIKVEPNLDKKDLWHGNKPAFGDSDVIVISSDSELESKLRVKKEDARLRSKGPTVRAKSRGKVRNWAIPVADINAMSNEAFDRGSFIQVLQTAWTDSDIVTSFVIEGDPQVTVELWVM